MKMRMLSIGDIADVLPGYAFKSSQYSSDGVKLLRGVNVSPETIDWSDCAFWRKSDGDGLDNYILQNEDIVIGMDRPWISSGFRIARVGDNDLPSLLVQRVARLRTRQGHNQRYLYYILCASAFQSHLKNLHTETTVPHISHKDIESFKVEMPSLSEQRRIADILDKADAIRRKRKQAIALTDQLLRSTFLEMFGDPVTNPKGWPVATVGNVADVQGGLQVTHARENNPISVPYLRVANVFRDKIDLTEIKQIRITESEMARAILQSGDVLVVEGHGNPDELGRAAVWLAQIDPCTHQNHLIRVRPKLGIIDSHYLCSYLNSNAGRQQMLRFGNTTSGLNTISTNNVRSVSIAVPPTSLQKRFALFVSQLSKVLKSLRTAECETQVLFASLIDRAFRGELSRTEQVSGQLSMF